MFGVPFFVSYSQVRRKFATMPTIAVERDHLMQSIGKDFTDQEFDELCFEFGIELDEVTSEKKMLAKEQGEDKAKGASETVIYKIEVPANRYDLLCAEGLVRALKVFLGRMEAPHYVVTKSKTPQIVHVKPATKDVRRFVVAGILRNVTFSQSNYKSFIELQEKLHQTIGRRRAIVSMGTHDLDTIEGPFTYDAQPPSQIKFKPLKQHTELSGPEIMDLYSQDSHLRQYVPIIQDKPLYPVIYDRNGVVLSLPPIINGNHSQITLNTKNVFIEVTATDLNKANIVLNSLVTSFSEYCEEPYYVECVEILEVDGSSHICPELNYRHETVQLSEINMRIGIGESAESVAALLTRMCLKSSVTEEGRAIKVEVPPTRPDIIHCCDIIEDAAIAYGFNKIKMTFPNTTTIAKQLAINKLSDQLRNGICATGFTEVFTFALCSRDDIANKLRGNIDDIPAVHIGNPKSTEFQVVRTTLLPGLLKTIASNKNRPLPLKLFEISDVVLKTSDKAVGATNRRHLGAVFYGKTPCFEVIHSLLHRILQLLQIPFNRNGAGYVIKSADRPAFFPGRCGEVYVDGRLIGNVGVLHPDVLSAFELNMAVSALEICVETFV